MQKYKVCWSCDWPPCPAGVEAIMGENDWYRGSPAPKLPSGWVDIAPEDYIRHAFCCKEHKAKYEEAEKQADAAAIEARDRTFRVACAEET